jgi:hypothetical protein
MNNRPKIKRRKSSRAALIQNGVYGGSFKSPMSWSIGGSW